MAAEVAFVADAEIDSPVGTVPGAPAGIRAVRPAGTVIHRPVRMRPVRLVRAGDGRRPGGHVVTAPARRRPPEECAPRSRGASLGWLILTSGLVALIVFGIGWLGSTGGTSPTAPVPAATTVVTIHSGETLWDVATSEAPSSAPQDVISRIESLNNIAGATIQPGERLLVPVESAH